MKAKLNEFKVSIRRQHKNIMFAEMRKEQQHMTRIDELSEKIFTSDLRKQNFETLTQYFREINICLAEFSKIGSKGSILNAGKLLQEIGDIPFNPLEGLSKKFSILTSEKFKKLVLLLFQEVQKVTRGKISHQWHQIYENLLFELTFMTGMLFKEPESLAMLFPFNSTKVCLRNEDKQQNEYKSDQEEDIFERSFEMFEYNISYLKQYFQDLGDQSENQLILFLTTVHSISATLQFFVVNNQKTKRSTMRHNSSSDEQKIAYFFSLLKSHNFEHYLQKILENLSVKPQEDQDRHQINEMPIFLSMLSLIDKYFNFREFGGFQIQVKSLNEKVKKFHHMVLIWFSSQKYGPMQPQTEQNNHKCQKLGSQYNFNTSDLRLLFQLHCLSCNSIISFNDKDIIPLCYETIEFLLVNGEKTHDQINIYQKMAQSKSRNTLQQFYFTVLVAEQGERWMHFLQILTSLQSLIIKYNISLDQILSYSIEKDTIFSQQMVLKLFQDMSYCIINISGYFCNDRHLFVQSLVNVFVVWSHNSFKDGNQMWSSRFWVNISDYLCRLIDEVQLAIHANEGFDRVYEQNTRDQKEKQDVDIDSNPRNIKGSPIIVLLQELRNLVELTMQQIINQSFDSTLEIDI